MSLFGVIRRTVAHHRNNSSDLRLREALAALPYRLEVARTKVLLCDRQFWGFNFWIKGRQMAYQILKEAERAKNNYCGRELDEAGRGRIEKKVSGHVSKLNKLIERLDGKNLDRLAYREQLGEEISKTEKVVADLSNEFEGYRFWLSGNDELKAAHQVMGQEVEIEALRGKTERIKAMREGLVSTASSLRAVNKKLSKLQSFYCQLDIGEPIRIKMFAAFATVKSQIMRDNCWGTIWLVLRGGFEKELKRITFGINDEIMRAFGVFGVRPGVPLKQIRKTYLELIFKNHPDRKGGGADEEMAKKITAAYARIEDYFENAPRQAQQPNW